MNQDELKALLHTLHSELAARPQVDTATREALQALDADIQRVLAQSGDAANDPQGPADQDDLTVRAQTLEARLEAEHPVLVGTLRDLMDRLGKRGI